MFTAPDQDDEVEDLPDELSEGEAFVILLSYKESLEKKRSEFEGRLKDERTRSFLVIVNFLISIERSLTS